MFLLKQHNFIIVDAEELDIVQHHIEACFCLGMHWQVFGNTGSGDDLGC